MWTDRAAGLYRQALAAQWDPAAAIDWDTPFVLPDQVERAVMQVMTFLIENEEAALVVPARFLGQVHPHFREIQQVLAVTVADEARHIEVFTRRATCRGGELALSSVGGRASLQTLLDEPDFAVASFLLSVMGEGTFVSLLSFLERHAPDPLTRRIAQLTRADEARHVAFAMAHLERHATLDPSVRGRLARAVERRHRELDTTAGLNEEVFDALVLIAAGAPTPSAIAAGWARVQARQAEMNDAREGRLARLGFSAAEADALAALHSRNFM
ncbi:MAG: ferritin-like domain-containing protein [Acidimicrobiales bacterium]